MSSTDSPSPMDGVNKIQADFQVSGKDKKIMVMMSINYDIEGISGKKWIALNNISNNPKAIEKAKEKLKGELEKSLNVYASQNSKKLLFRSGSEESTIDPSKKKDASENKVSLLSKIKSLFQKDFKRKGSETSLTEDISNLFKRNLFVGEPVNYKKMADKAKNFNKTLGLDVLENDNFDLEPNFLSNRLKDIKEGNTLKKSTTYVPKELDTSFKDNMPELNYEIISGEGDSIHGTTTVGNQTLSVATCLRAVEKGQGFKPVTIQDRVSCKMLEFTDNKGNNIQTTLLVSCDGNKKEICADYFSTYFNLELKDKLQLELNNNKNLTEELILKTIDESYNKLCEKWAELVEIDRKSKTEDELKSGSSLIDSNTTFNANFIYPNADGTLNCISYNIGDSRSLIIKANGDVEQAHPLKLSGIGISTLHPGDSLFVSSDGIWHTGTLRTVGTLVHEQFNERKNNLSEEDQKKPEELAKIQENVLKDLVLASSQGREDDRNPMLLHFPAVK